jgi:hypothetical protein
MLYPNELRALGLLLLGVFFRNGHVCTVLESSRMFKYAAVLRAAHPCPHEKILPNKSIPYTSSKIFQFHFSGI